MREQILYHGVDVVTQNGHIVCGSDMTLQSNDGPVKYHGTAVHSKLEPSDRQKYGKIRETG